MPMSHLLAWFYPRFLELEDQWVDLLLDAERDHLDKNGSTCIMNLLVSCCTDYLYCGPDIEPLENTLDLV